MSNIKLNKKVNESDFDVIPDAPAMDSNVDEGNPEILIKNDEEGGRKLFANRKANIALSIAGGIIVFLIIAAIIFINIPIG